MKEISKNDSFTKVNNSPAVYNYDRVSDWFDADSHKTFMRTVQSGDILEVRSTRCSHWGICLRLQSSPSKGIPDDVTVYHVIHSAQSRGQVGQFSLEQFWAADSKIRINNTSNGSCIFGNSQILPKPNVLHNAVTALLKQLKWHTCCDFIRWSSLDHNND